MDELKAILTEQFGFLTKPQAARLARINPDFEVVVRPGCSARFRCSVSDLPRKIKELEKAGDYERGVFIEAGKVDELKAAFGI